MIPDFLRRESENEIFEFDKKCALVTFCLIWLHFSPNLSSILSLDVSFCIVLKGKHKGKLSSS